MMYRDTYAYAPGFRRRRRFPGARSFRGGGPGRGWCHCWFDRDAPYFGVPPWAGLHEAVVAGEDLDETAWLKAKAAALRAEATAIKEELFEIERCIAEIKQSEEE